MSCLLELELCAIRSFSTRPFPTLSANRFIDDPGVVLFPGYVAVPVYSSIVVVLDTGRQIKEVMSMHEMQIGGYCIYFPPEGLIRCDTYFAKVA